MTEDRVTLTDKGKLDEIVATKGAHLERLGKHSWFISFDHADGSSTTVWFESKDLVSPMIETRATLYKEIDA